jgi:hypothetical protein
MRWFCPHRLRERALLQLTKFWVKNRRINDAVIRDAHLSRTLKGP